MTIFDKTYKKFWDALECKDVGELEGLAFAANSIGIKLEHIDKRVIRLQESPSEEVFNWFLNLKSGLYIIVCDVHAISVDFERGLIFDCGYYYALRLSRECLAYCGIRHISKIRRIKLPQYLIPKK